MQFRNTRTLQHGAHSQDLAPSDYHLFPALKEYLSGHRFKDDCEVQTDVTRWLIAQGTD
jgi:hypothetical protein